jgi:hypothetical protein
MDRNAPVDESFAGFPVFALAKISRRFNAQNSG